MKRIFASAAILLTVFNSPALAFTGGPFDNGLNSASLDRNAIYQAILTFGNGSGFCYFTPTSNFAANGSTSGGATILNGNQAIVDTRGSVTNRMVLYYKGLTYVGSALGTSDFEARQIQCTLNGNTNANEAALAASSTTTASTNAFTSSSSASTTNAISQTILSNTSSFTVNGNFTARIEQTAPTMRFSGEGELAFIAPNTKDAQAGLAYIGYSGLVNSIVTAVGNANVSANFDPNVFTLAETAIQNAVAALGTVSLTSVDGVYQAAQIRHLSVDGTRRYM